MPRPVQHIDQPCPYRPFAGEVSVRDGSGSEVADVHADAAGHFRVDLAPGTYQPVPVSPHPGMSPFGKSQTVPVVAGLYSQVTIAYDSGIR
ncbi:MAG: carboxypeptidase regulatory-like domain-containing protein [Chloroflexi bacterium]|nr:MAG: carboxypeptidase regulatory-like domain-containing protein [Chloroflexota bacterium]